MSSVASLNGFRGYTYQYQVFYFFLVKMDYDREIKNNYTESDSCENKVSKYIVNFMHMFHR